MKLNKLFEATQEVMTEGLRFGRKEESLVERESNNIRVGIEYEFHLNEEFAEDNEEYDQAVWERAAELQEEHVKEKREEFIDSYAENDFSEFSAGDITASINSIKDTASAIIDSLNEISSNESDIESALDSFDEEEFEVEDDQYHKGFDNEDDYNTVEEFMKRANQMEDEIEDIRTEADNLAGYDYIEEVLGYMDLHNWSPSDLEAAASDLYDFYNKADPTMQKDNIEDMMNEWVGPDTLIDELSPIMDLSGTDSDWDEEIKERMTDSAEDLWESEKEHYLGFDPEIGTDEQFLDAAAEDVDREDYTEGTPEEYAERTMAEDGVNMTEWEEITTDASVTNGVECITKPLALKESHELMEEVFEYIQDHGSTSSDTGMHVNMSLKGIKFSKKSFNPTKLVMLMDEKYMHEKFDVRATYAPAHWQQVTPVVLINFAKAASGQELLEKVERDFIQDHKYRTINLGSVFDSMLDSRRRIEFRFFGGAGYEDDYDKMVYEINRAAYMMMAAFSPAFGHKEYMKKILKVLDKITKKFFMMDFLTFSKAVKSLRGNDLQHFWAAVDTARVQDTAQSQWTLMTQAMVHHKPFRKYAEKWLTHDYGSYLESSLKRQYGTDDISQALAQIKTK